MIILNVDKLAKSFGFGQLFENLSFSLNEGEILSVVGPNGCGKTTLLKMIAGSERIDSGSVNIKKGAKVAYLDQTGASKKDSRKVVDIFKDVFIEINEMNKNIQYYQNLINTGLDDENYDKVMTKYCSLIEQFSEKGGYDVDYKIKYITEGLKIEERILNQSYDDLSGGEKTLVQLAKALLIQPDLFLLDEPTNHLDIERIEWLEGYLKSFKGAVVIVSHDRYFLDKISKKILSLDFGEPKVYTTNYTGYLQERENEFEKQMALYKDQQIIIKRFEEQIKYFAQMGMAKNSSTMCDRAHSLQTQLDRIKKNSIARPKEIKKLDFEFDSERKNSKRIVTIENYSVEIPNDKTILKDINLTIANGERIALIGNNGSGKSTLIKGIMGTQTLIEKGEIKVGDSVKIGYLPQMIMFENENIDLLTYFMEASNSDEKRARQILAGFHFYKEDVMKKLKNLSGGERIKLKLLELLQQKINTLIFDEPTNHIDIPTKEDLEDALNSFDGTIIFVSHDRYFINKFAEKIIEFKNQGITIYYGNYDYYKEQKNKR